MNPGASRGREPDGLCRVPAGPVAEPPPEARKSKAKDAKAKHGEPAEDDYPEEPTNGDLDADYYELPKDWHDLHHKKLIALAKRLGGEGDALATRDGAIAYIEERATLEGNRLHLERHDA